jgi:hypothetical protein
MQTKALAGNQASETATRGSVWRQDATVITAKVQPNRKEVAMFDDRWGDSRDRDHDPRDVDVRDREPVDPRDVFMQDLDLPRSDERERVHDRDRDYRLRESETRTLSTVGAFRVVSSRDLRDHDGDRADPRSGDLRSLRDQGLIRTVDMPGRKDVAVVLTDRGRSLLEWHRRNHDREDRQEFYAELKKPREMEHDAQIYGAYLREAERLQERGARIERSSWTTN